jgi:hypothetical protein
MPRDARYGAGRKPGCSLSISQAMSLTLKANLGSSSFPLAIAKTLPPTFQTCDPFHWIT